MLQRFPQVRVVYALGAGRLHTAQKTNCSGIEKREWDCKHASRKEVSCICGKPFVEMGGVLPRNVFRLSMTLRYIRWIK